MDNEDKQTVKTIDVMENTPRITVIMGIYNCADTLIEALESLEAQTYKRFKVILCDDGSKDNTLEVARKWVETHPNYFVIWNERNMKLAATLNHCLDYADTEYVARMDGDDISLPTRFEKELNFLEEHPEYALVSCPMIHFDEYGDWKVGKSIEKPIKESFRKFSPFCHAPVMIRTGILKSVGGYTAESKTERMEDYYLWYKIYKQGFIGYNLQEPLYKMRDDKNAIIRRKVSDRLRGFKTDLEITKGLGLSFYWVYPVLHLSKILVPKFMVSFVRKLKEKI